MAKPKVTETEVRFARALLHALHANETNGYLLLAVIAWMRAESGQHYLGNNPFNIRNSSYAIGYRQTAKNGHFAIFKDLGTAAKATAAFLVTNAAIGHYAPIIAAARRGSGSDNGVTQAIDFLTALAMSKWSSDHYGAADGDKTTNRLIKVWAGLTGTPIPASWFQDTKKPPKPPKPKFRQGVSTLHTPSPADYIQPHTAESFYHARPHLGDFVLPREDA